MKIKRFIIALGILQITSTALSHPYGGLLSYFHERPAFEFHNQPFAVEQGADGRFINVLTPQKFKALLEEQWMKEEMSLKTYSFFNNDKFYMLSYDTCKACMSSTNFEGMRRERPIYLFRLDDSQWVIASDKPLQVDWEETQNGITSYVSYFPWRTAGDKPEDEREFGGGAKNGSVKISADGVVTIEIINHSMADQYQSAPHFSNKTIVLLPNADGTFEVQ